MAPKPHGPFSGSAGASELRGRRGLGPGRRRRGLLGRRRRCRCIGGLGGHGRFCGWFWSRFRGRFRSGRGRRRRCRRSSGLGSRRRRRRIGGRRCRCVGGCGGRRSGSRRRRRRIVGGRRRRGRARVRSGGRGRRVAGRRRCVGALQRRSPSLGGRKGVRDGDRDGHAGLLDIVEHADRRLRSADPSEHGGDESEHDDEPHPSAEGHLSSHPRRRATADRAPGGRHGRR